MTTRLILLFIIVLFLPSCGKEKVELLTDLIEQDANEVAAALISNGIEAKKSKTKKSISVTIYSKDMARAVSVLKAEGLPNKTRSSMGEIFKKEGMISTPLEERARYIYALSQELEFTLSQIDKVLVARVHVVLSERIAPGHPILPSSAAIFIKHLPELDPDIVEPKIMRLVSSSIPGLNKVDDTKISISFVPSTLEKPQTHWTTMGGFMLSQESASKFSKLAKNTLWSLFFILIIVFLFFLIKRKNSFSFLKKIKNNDRIETLSK